MKATWTEITAAVMANDVMREELKAFWAVDEGEELKGDECKDYFDSASDMMRALMQGAGLVIGEEEVSWTIEALHVVSGLTQLVLIGYGDVGGGFAEGEEGEKARKDLWKGLGCSGDDDVDYNGSYVQAGVDMLMWYTRLMGGEEAMVVKYEWERKLEGVSGEGV